ncbi:dynamin GTPase [Apostasia shenzhenica]|uniref:Dynamin GTPase n=1 Tax=Apostasia shenzhenica TaxID=1088818 RepID=A0A2I0BG32_9ASPA|nr:dynamin GTPase [Apostasia shenzhenica]
MAFLLSSSLSFFSDSFPLLSPPPRRILARHLASSIKATASAEPNEEKASNVSEGSSESKASSEPPRRPKKPQYSMQKGRIVRVDKEKYLNSINYLSVGHPPYYKGLDYIYEDRGEILDLRIFETGEYALIAWVGIPTAPAWLPTDMLIKSEKLNYERF